jgi:hypothetical protein
MEALRKNRIEEALSMIPAMTSNGKFQTGDRLQFEGTVEGINGVGNGIRVLVETTAGNRKFVITLPERVDATVIARTDGTAHPTQPWENLLPATKRKMEERATTFIDSVINQHVL